MSALVQLSCKGVRIAIPMPQRDVLEVLLIIFFADKAVAWLACAPTPQSWRQPALHAECTISNRGPPSTV